MLSLSSLCAVVLAAAVETTPVAPAPAPEPAPASAPAAATSVQREPYLFSSVQPYGEVVGGVLGGYLGSFILIFPALAIPQGHTRDVYAFTAWTLTAPLAAALGVHLSAGIEHGRRTSYGWAVLGAVGGEAVAAGLFFALGGADRVLEADRSLGPAFWPLVLAPLFSAVGATVAVELTAKSESDTKVALAPLVVPTREGVAQGLALSAQW